MQLSNAELLDLMKDGKGDERDSPEQKNGDAQSEPLPDHHFDLPGSPLTDPRLLDARNRYKKRKLRPSKEKSAFQSKLLNNPYAHALATPPRLCLLTNVRVPNYFLIPFGLESHPKTGAPWHLPRLPVPPPYKLNRDSESNTNSDDTAASSSQASSAAQSESPAPLAPELTRSLTGTYFLASQNVLQHVSKLQEPSYRRLMPFRWKQDSSVKIANIVWRKDMDTFVLEALRENVVRRLVYLSSSSAGYISRCKNHEHISKHHQVGAVLWLGPKFENAVEPNSSNEGERPTGDAVELGLPPYAMHRYKDRYIPVYDLLKLLGQAKLRMLRETRRSCFDEEYAVIKMKRLTVEVQLELWKLMGYLAPAETGG